MTVRTACLILTRVDTFTNNKKMCLIMEKKKCRQSISEEFKLSVIRDYYSSGMSQHACSRKYHLRSYSLLPTWLKKYGEKVKSLSLPAEESNDDNMGNRSKESYREENARLKKRVKELEKTLSFSRLETEARDLMITRAEEYFNIPIRKKSGAKQ